VGWWIGVALLEGDVVRLVSLGFGLGFWFRLVLYGVLGRDRTRFGRWVCLLFVLGSLRVSGYTVMVGILGDLLWNGKG